MVAGLVGLITPEKIVLASGGRVVRLAVAVQVALYAQGLEDLTRPVGYRRIVIMRPIVMVA